jgi:hypothetical protein
MKNPPKPARTTTKPADVKSDTTPAPSPAPKTERERPDAGDRLTIPIGADGRPAVEQMRDKTRERLRKLVSDPAVAKSLGVESAPAVQVLPRQFVMMLVTAIGQLETIIVHRATGADPRIVAAIVPFTPEESELVADPLEVVLNKYAPAALNKYADEAALIGLLTTLTFRKIEAVRAAQSANRGPANVVPIRAVEPVAPAPAPAEPGPEPAADVPPEVFQ